MITATPYPAAPLPHPEYRADIDGLRAVAVLSVIGFHAFPEWIKGGYVGVDVFFVISGYLISGILFGALEKGTFSIATFYSRRIRRIFAALILVLLFSWACGWFLLVSNNYKALGKEIAGGAGFVANLVAWRDAGYFANASETNPLLHLWSLGIEEQFYIAWPLIVYLTWKKKVNWLLVTGLILGASFAFDVMVVRTDAVASFYSPFSRFWELLVGCALAYLTLHGQSIATSFRDAASIAGLVLIATAILVLDKYSAFPGWWALLPTIGAFLVLAAGSQARPNRLLLSNPAMKWIGLISYPLYLWHWPLLTFARILQFGAPSRYVRIGAVIASVLLAWLTYRFVESPIRTGGQAKQKVTALCMAMAAVFALGYFTYWSGGIEQRPIDLDERARFVNYYAEMHRIGLKQSYHLECDFRDWRTARKRTAIDPQCVRPGEKGTWFLWGDSHAEALSHGLRSLLPDGFRMAQVTTASCKPSDHPRGARMAGDPCDDSNRYALEEIAKLKPDIVFIAQLDKHTLTDWEEMADSIRAAGARRVMLLGPVPHWNFALPLIIAKDYWGIDHERISTGLDPTALETDSRMVEKYGHSEKIDYVSLVAQLCDARGCLATIPGKPGNYNLMAVDDGHLTPDASIFVATQSLGPSLRAPSTAP
jgi:peptidoglycan/LPS O-acetylase OafA/YrhL